MGFAGVTPHVALYVPDFKGVIQLGFVLIFVGGNGRHEFTLEILNETSGAQFIPKASHSFQMNPRVTSSMYGFQVITPLPGAGLYKIRIAITGAPPHETSFQVHQGAAPA